MNTSTIWEHIHMEERAGAKLTQAFVKVEMPVAAPRRPIRELNLSRKISEREINVYRGREGNNKNNLGTPREAEVFSKHVNAEVLKHSLPPPPRTPNLMSFQPRPPPYICATCIMAVVCVAMCINDTIHYIGTKGLSCLSNKDENKIPAKSRRNCRHALRLAVLFPPREKLFNPLFKELRFSNFI